MRKALLACMLLLPSVALAERASWMGGCGLNTIGVRYCGTGGGAGTENAQTAVHPLPFRLNGLRVVCEPPIDPGHFTFTVRVEGASSTVLTGCIGASSPDGCASPTTLEIAADQIENVDAGESLSMMIEPANGANDQPYCRWESLKTTQAGGGFDASIMFGGSGGGAHGNDRFGGPATDTANAALLTAASSATVARWVMPGSGTLSGFGGASPKITGITGVIEHRVCKLCNWNGSTCVAMGTQDCSGAADGETGLVAVFDHSTAATGTPALLRTVDTTCTDNCSYVQGDQYVVREFLTTACSGTCTSTTHHVITANGMGEFLGWSNGFLNGTRYWSINRMGGTKANHVMWLGTGGTIKNFVALATNNTTANPILKACWGNTPAGAACSDTVQCQMGAGTNYCFSTATAALADEDYFAFEVPAITGLVAGENVFVGVELDSVVPDTPTPTLTNTPTHTPTQTPTFTPTPTATNTPTPTNTPILTATPLPSSFTADAYFTQATGVCTMSGTHGGRVSPRCTADGANTGTFVARTFMTWVSTPTFRAYARLTARAPVAGANDEVYLNVACTAVARGTNPTTIAYNAGADMTVDLGTVANCGENALCWSPESATIPVYDQTDGCGPNCAEAELYCRWTWRGTGGGANLYTGAVDFSSMHLSVAGE